MNGDPPSTASPPETGSSARTGAPSAEAWSEIHEIVDGALEVPAGERAAFVVRACGDDVVLRSEVDRFLAVCDATEDWLEEPAVTVAALVVQEMCRERAAHDGPVDGTRVGPYRLIREVGRGGMGAVFLAERDDAQYRKRVALKLARGGTWPGGDEHLIRRLLEERQILASLEHPNIARLLDGGVTDDGQPWFAMEYVEGTPFDRYCDDRRLTVDERLALFCAVCDAVAFAHRNLVVHRDLKPSNVLVTDDGMVRLLDFGIARLLAPADVAMAQPPATRTVFHALTPEYASPEELRGERVSTASDVYSLGVLLYRLLAGCRPYVLDSRALPHEMARAILEQEPLRPSAAVLRADNEPQEVAAARRTTPARLRRRLHGDIDTIVLTAMQKARERRYATADHLAADVRRHLAALPVSARPDSRAYRTARFVRRHRTGVAATAVFVLTLVGFSAVTAVQSRRIQAQAVQLVSERDRARGISDFIVGLFSSANPFSGGGPETTVREVLADGALRARSSLTDQPALRAELLAVIGGTYHGLGMYTEARSILEAAAALHALEGEGDGEPLWLSINVRLAQVLQELGEYARAEMLLREVLAERRLRFEPGDNAIARSLSTLGKLLTAQGRDAEALPLLHQALAIDRTATGEHGARVHSQSLTNLGNALIAQGDYAAAERMHRDAYEIRRAAFGETDPETANSLVRLAVALRHQGRLAESESLLTRALAAKRVVLGADHSEISADELELAATLHAKGELPTAEALYRKALDAERGGAGTRLAQALAGLGAVLLDRGALHEAEASLREALELYVGRLPPGHWTTAMTRQLLGSCLAALGRRAEAEALLTESVATLRASRGENDERTRRAVNALVGLRENIP